MPCNAKLFAAFYENQEVFVLDGSREDSRCLDDGKDDFPVDVFFNIAENTEKQQRKGNGEQKTVHHKSLILMQK